MGALRFDYKGSPPTDGGLKGGDRLIGPLRLCAARTNKAQCLSRRPQAVLSMARSRHGSRPIRRMPAQSLPSRARVRSLARYWRRAITGVGGVGLEEFQRADHRFPIFLQLTSKYH